jgi:VWFA-related protein
MLRSRATRLAAPLSYTSVALWIGLLGCLLVLTNTASAWPSAFPQQSLQSTAELVKVDVSVADGHGNFLSGLAQQDFRIFDNGVEQPVSFFVPTDAPAQILVMIETGPAVYLIHDEHLAAAYSLVAGLDPADQVALVTYDQVPRRILAFTAEKSSLLSAIGGIEYNIGMAELNFYQSLSEVLDWLQAAPGKRAIVLLTTGLDSSQPPRWDALVDKLRRDDVVIFPVALGGPLRSATKPKRQKLEKIPNGPSEAEPSPSSSAARNPVSFARADQDLRALASITGGRAYFPQSSDDFVPIYREIAAALRHQYVLGFAPLHDGKYHTISVEVALSNGHFPKPGQKNVPYRVFARAGYLAPGP